MLCEANFICIPMIDYYEILEVSPNAGQDVISAVHGILMQRYDPNKNANSPDANQKIIAIKLAYDVLSDPEKRKAYDTELDKGKSEITGFSRNQGFNEQAIVNVSEISGRKPDQKAAVGSKSNTSNQSSILSRLKWNRWGWVLSILVVIFILISMVRPDPEKVKQGQLAVKLEAERDREELAAELKKQAAKEQNADTIENEKKVVEAAKAKSALITPIKPAP